METARPANLVKSELVIAQLLRYGVLLCAAIMIFGIALLLLHPGTDSLLAQAMQGNAGLELAPKSFASFYEKLTVLEPNAVIALGFVLLVALPIVRVGLTIIIFIQERDYTYVAIASLVFGVLLLGIVLGKEL